MSAKISLGKEPPRLGNRAGFLPLLASIDPSVHWTQGSSGSRRVACDISARTDSICTIAKPWRSRWRRRAGRMSLESMPTTKRSWQRAQARGGIALTGASGLPTLQASTSNEHQPKTRSAGDRPGSPQRRSIVGPSSPPSTSQSASARRTTAGSCAGSHSGTRICPLLEAMLAMACAN